MSALHARHRPESPARGVSFAARTIGLVASLAWAFILISSLIVEGAASLRFVGAVLGVLMLIAIGGVAIGFADEEKGGAIALMAGLALALFAAATAGRNHWLAILVTGAPFIASGILFIVSARKDEQLRS